PGAGQCLDMPALLAGQRASPEEMPQSRSGAGRPAVSIDSTIHDRAPTGRAGRECLSNLCEQAPGGLRAAGDRQPLFPAGRRKDLSGQALKPQALRAQRGLNAMDRLDTSAMGWLAQHAPPPTPGQLVAAVIGPPRGQSVPGAESSPRVI